MDPTSVSNVMAAWQDTFTISMINNNYKNGAFKHLITPTTPPLQSVDILLASDLLSGGEKATLRISRDVLSIVLSLGPKLTLNQSLLLGLQGMQVTNMFEDDMRKQGLYVPPTMAQVMGSNN
jgi:hypothetical protein